MRCAGHPVNPVNPVKIPVPLRVSVPSGTRAAGDDFGVGTSVRDLQEVSSSMQSYLDDYHRLEERLAGRGVDVARVKERLKAQEIETPSWGYADSGTRFGVFPQAGAAVTIFEKLEDAAQVHRQTGIAPLVATHVLWDMADDPGAVAQRARELGVRIGSIHPNCFQDRDYWFGSITSRDPATRRKAVEHMLDSVELGKRFGSDVLSLWFAD